MTLLSVRNLRKSFGGNAVVAGVSFDVAPGEIVALIGPNGAGKSTCFGMISGQIRPDGGDILLDGTSIAGKSPDRICRLGAGRGFQIAAAFGSLTVRDNVRAALLARHRTVWRFFRPAARVFNAEAEALLARTGLLHLADTDCATLAYGDLKRLDLALALSNAPRLLLMDEPTAGMTLTHRRHVMDLLRVLVRDTGCGALLTEHDTDAVFRVADRVLVMDRGTLIAEGEPAAITANPLVQAAYLGT